MVGMFPKGASHFLLRGSAVGKSPPLGIPTTLEAKLMATTVETHNRSYVIQVSDDDGKDLGTFIIDQYVVPRSGERGLQRVRDQVERQLFHQFRKTGHHHHVIFEGDRRTAEMVSLRPGEDRF